MSLFVYLQGALVAVSSIRLRGDGYPGPNLAADADGNMAQGSITFDDPTGALTVTGWQSLTVDEPECSASRLFTGYVAERTYRRGPYRLGAGREIDTTINDQNILLAMRLIDGPDGKRGKESDRDRLDWLLRTYLHDLVYDLGLVAASTTFMFDEGDFRGQYALDVLSDLAQQREFIFFAYWDHVEGKVGLFFEPPDSISHTSTLSISNVLSDTGDIDDPATLCFAADMDSQLESDPSEVYSRVRFARTGGVGVYNNLATAAAFFPSPINTRGVQVTNERVGLLSTQTRIANQILTKDSVERFKVTCSVRLPAAKVGLIEAGHRISVRFSHLPGFESFAWTRVEQRTIQQTDGDPTHYDVGLVLSTSGLTTATGGGDPGDFPHQPPGPAAYVQEKGFDGDHIDFDHLQTDGHLMTWFVVSRNYPGVDLTATTPSGWTMLASCYDGTGISTRTAAVYYRIASGEDTHLHQFSGVPGLSMHAIEWSDGVSIDTASGQYGSINAQTAPGTLASVSVAPSAIATLVGNLLVGSNDINAIDVVPGSGVTQLWYSAATGFSPRSWVGIKTEQTGASNVPAALTGTNGWGGITYAVHAAGAGEPPDPAQPVPWAVVTMDGADGTTEFPYAAGSLQLRLNGVPISTASFTERDPSCGDFTLSWVPFADDVITASYQGAA